MLECVDVKNGKDEPAVFLPSPLHVGPVPHVTEDTRLGSVEGVLWGVVLFTLFESFAVARVLEPCTPFKTEVLLAQVYLELVAIADHIGWGHKVERPLTDVSPTPCNWWVHHLHASQSLKMTKTTKINKHEVYLTGLAQHMDALGNCPETERWIAMHA